MAGRFSVEAIFKAVDRVTAPVTRMQNRVSKMTRSMTKGLRKVNRALKGVIGGFSKGARAIAKFGGVALAATGAAVVTAINRVADAADSLAKQSRRLQFPIEELQEWKFVAEQSGVSTELLDKSLGAFSKRLGEAKNGLGPLVSGLKKLNPELLKQLISTDSVAESFEIYINAIREAESATEKAALANAAFSRSGLELVNIADNSTNAIKALRLEQRQNGVITREQAAAAEEYNDAVNSLKRSLFGLLQGVIIPMLPKITETVRAWRDWIVVNKDMISTRITDFFISVKNGVLNIVDAVRKLNDKYNLVDLFGKTVDAISKLITVLTENGATILKVTAAVVGLVVALNTMSAILAIINALTAANPFVLMVVGVLALAAAFATVIQFSDKLIDGFKKMPKVLQILLLPIRLLLEALNAVKNVGSFLGTKLGGALFDLFGGSPDTVNQAGAPQVVSPQERVARSIDEQRTTSTAEVTIRDETGRAEVTSGKLGAGLSLQSSGAF